MKIILLTQKQYVVSAWTGGTTTQLAIAPDGSHYQNRDFVWRVSSASVTQDSSDFTLLPDYDRLICVLEGEMRLTHNGAETITLSPYTIHGFDGGANTRSEGRCVDFNLMTRKNRCRGSLQAAALEGLGRREVLSSGAGCTMLIYCREGAGLVRSEDRCQRVAAGESVLIEDAGDIAVFLEGAGLFLLAEMRC